MNLQEQIRRILIEETQGLKTFMDEIKKRYEVSDELEKQFLKFIEESNCRNIEFTQFKYPADGLALHDGVLINRRVLNMSLGYTIFVTLHEVAHQYQFKKYGEEKMYELYTGDATDEEAADFMLKTELVADEFALRKTRQLQKQGLLDSKYFEPTSFYKRTSVQTMIPMVRQLREGMKKMGASTPDKISEYFYNMVKKEL